MHKPELELELELELIHTQMAQKPMLRAEVYARAQEQSQAWCGTTQHHGA
jgi:hypothetical protein